jgi:hypothetical protein
VSLPVITIGSEYTPSQKIYEAWLALPLIVLAGLR